MAFAGIPVMLGDVADPMFLCVVLLMLLGGGAGIAILTWIVSRRFRGQSFLPPDRFRTRLALVAAGGGSSVIVALVMLYLLVELGESVDFGEQAWLANLFAVAFVALPALLVGNIFYAAESRMDARTNPTADAD
jgi:hypothetical protein